MKSAEMLAVGWLERKLPEETDAYRHVMKVAHQIIAEAFSNKVVTPGVTTSEDLVWWMRQRVANMGLGQWFHPSITIHRKGGLPPGTAPDARVIQRGDMLHTDFGLVYLGFSTDTQHNAYVLLPGETDAPAGLKAGLQAANRLQDLTMKFATVGADGKRGAGGGARAGEGRGPDPVHLLPPRRLSWACGRTAHRHDRLSRRRPGSGRIRVPAGHVAFD